jgi:hypothetical protein
MVTYYVVVSALSGDVQGPVRELEHNRVQEFFLFKVIVVRAHISVCIVTCRLVLQHLFCRSLVPVFFLLLALLAALHGKELFSGHLSGVYSGGGLGFDVAMGVFRRDRGGH